jgi:hypothetical protein
MASTILVRLIVNTFEPGLYKLVFYSLFAFMVSAKIKDVLFLF